MAVSQTITYTFFDLLPFLRYLRAISFYDHLTYHCFQTPIVAKSKSLLLIEI